ncbi:MAG: HPr family phosphocarrier protein [Clostridia bacterium]|nr:HPr family phosphocarrier protein [Clostridia bacterium]
MKRYEIRLSLAENVKTFVGLISRQPFDMDLRAGRHVVDAKSILGIFSLDLSRPIFLEFDETSADPAQVEALLKDIKPFLVE